MHGTVRGLFKLLGAVAMLTLLAAAWLVYRMSEGPLSLSPLTPYIQQALSRPADGISVGIGDTILTWSRDSHSLEIEGVDVHLAKGGTIIATLPEMSVRLSGAALLRGKLVPRAIRLLHPALHLLRDEQGVFSFGIGGEDGGGANGATALADIGVDALLAPPGRETLAGQLRSIQIIAASVTLEDRRLGLRWAAPRADLTFGRDSRGIALQARLDVELDGQAGHVVAEGIYLDQDRSLDLSLSGGGIRPASLARLSPRLELLNAVQFPVGGALALRYHLDRGLVSLDADVAAGEGILDLTALAGFSMPVKSIGLKAGYRDDRLALRDLRVDLGGTVVTASGGVSDLATAMKLKLDFQADGAALDSLPGLWPKPLAPNPRAWIAANLSHGRIGAVSGSLSGHVPAGQGLGDLVVDSLSGGMTVEDATVRYMAGMPKVQHVAADARFDADSFTIALSGGEAAGLALPDGQVLLRGLSHADQDALITLKINGSIADVLRFIDNPPLGWTAKFGLDPAQIKGDARLRLSLDFPLVDQLSLDRLAIKVDAETSGLAMPHVVQDLDLADGAFRLKVDNAGLDAIGVAQIDHRPANIRWRENFTKAAFRGRYQVEATLSEEGRRRAGLAAAPFQPPYLSGIVPVDVTATMLQAGRWEVGVKADLTPMTLTLPGLNYVKPAGGKGQATADLLLGDNRLTRIPRFRLTADRNLDVSGEAGFDKDGEIRRVVLQKASFARSELSGSILFHANDGGMTLAFNGGSFDAREILADRPSDPATDRQTKRPPAPPRPDRPQPSPAPDVVPLIVEGRFERVWLADEGWISNVAVDLSRDRHFWRRARIAAEVGDHQAMSVTLAPSDDRHSSLVVDSADAGALFQALDIFGTMRGGHLKVAASYDDAAAGRPLSGRIEIDEFQLVDAPVLAKLLTVAGLTGIVDLLSGQGIHFNKLDMPFSYLDGVLQVRDGQAAGSALGITAKGRIDVVADQLALDGTVVPAYALNSALGGLPLVGGLFTAEKGGGFLAINYSMTGPSGDPSFIVNPLSALTPGFLRHLFDIFDNNPPPAKPQP